MSSVAVKICKELIEKLDVIKEQEADRTGVPIDLISYNKASIILNRRINEAGGIKAVT